MILPLVMVTAQTTQVLTAKGVGIDHSAALDDAKRNAIEQGLGVFLSARTVASNFTLLSDNIITRAEGFVKAYKVISEAQTVDGGWEVTIEAAVTAMLDEILNDQAAIDILIQVMGRPRIMFLVNEQIEFSWFDRNSGLVETMLMQAFFDRNFNLVDREQLAAIRHNDMTRLAQQGNAEAAQNLGRMFKAECVVAGKASAVQNSNAYGMASIRGDLNVKVIRVDNGELLGVVHVSSTKAQPSPEAAARAAFEAAAEKAAQQIIAHLIRKWGGEAANFKPISLQINNVDFMRATDIEVWLKAHVPGVKTVSPRPFEGNVAEMEIGFEGTANELARALAGNTVYPVTVVNVTQNKIVLLSK